MILILVRIVPYLHSLVPAPPLSTDWSRSVGLLAFLLVPIIEKRLKAYQKARSAQQRLQHGSEVSNGFGVALVEHYALGYMATYWSSSPYA